jgi:predicted Rossmann-fold nucleotide-binding protein
VELGFLVQAGGWQMPRVFIQGSGSPTEQQAAVARRIGQLLAEKGWEANVGSHGGLVPVMIESGIPCHAYLTRFRKSVDVDSLTTTIDCNQLAEPIVNYLGKAADMDRMLPWSVRLGVWMARSDAFIFFAGDKGTMAHLVPVLAWIGKALAPEGKAKKVILVGWARERVKALETLGLVTEDDEWFTTCGTGTSAIDGIMPWLTS